MPARTVVTSPAGAVLSISAGIPLTFDQAGYESTDQIPTWTPVGEIENHGSHGVKATITEFVPVDTAVTTKMKGSKNYGTKTLSLGNLLSNPGQALLRAASESPNHYSVKVAYVDGEVHYLDVVVSDFEYVDGAVNDVRKINVTLAVCRAPVIVLPV